MHNVRKLVKNLALKGLLRPMESEVLEEEIAEAERLAEIGRAVEKALGVDYYESSVTNVKNLIEWYRESEAK